MSTITRARGFLEHGFDVAVFAFRRGRYNPHFKSLWPEVDLGRTYDGKYLHRIVKLLAALAVVWRNRTLVREASVLYARNMDQLLLAAAARAVAGGASRLVYEVLDVSPTLTRAGAFAALMRSVERCLLRFADAMVVSSPAFHRQYYLPIQGYRGRTFVIENRLHPADVAIVERTTGGDPPLQSLRRSFRWVIGYFGLIRGQRTFDLMTRLAERFPDILFYFRGVVTTVDARRFASTVAAHDNMVFGGAYVNPDDLKQLYGSVDFAWALDLEHEDHNSRWLMPCRFYEASLVGVPCLAARGFEVGDRVESLGVGWTLAPPYEDSFTQLFGRLTRAEYDAVVDRLTDLPLRSFVAGDDMTAFCQAIGGEGGLALDLPAPAIRLPIESGRAEGPQRAADARRQFAAPIIGVGTPPEQGLTPPPGSAAP